MTAWSMATAATPGWPPDGSAPQVQIGLVRRGDPIALSLADASGGRRSDTRRSVTPNAVMRCCHHWRWGCIPHSHRRRVRARDAARHRRRRRHRGRPLRRDLVPARPAEHRCRKRGYGISGLARRRPIADREPNASGAGRQDDRAERRPRQPVHAVDSSAGRLRARPGHIVMSTLRDARHLKSPCNHENRTREQTGKE
jgi:hypothetical protein